MAASRVVQLNVAPVRASASILIASPWARAGSATSSVPEPDYRILMLKRSATSKFFASTFVFPGGALDPADLAFPTAQTQPSQCSSQAHDVLSLQQCSSPHCRRWKAPPSSASASSDAVAMARALRICAVREAFEEAGLLLQPLSPPLSSDPRSQLPQWRKAVHADARRFSSLFEGHAHRLNIGDDRLHPIGRWVTPLQETRGTGGGSAGSRGAPRRFDCMFYASVLEKPAANVQGSSTASSASACHDDIETVDSQWLTPHEALSMFSAGHISLPPPTFYLLSVLQRHASNLQSLEDLLSSKIQTMDMQVMLPVIATRRSDGGKVILLPGDTEFEEAVRQLEGLEDAADLATAHVETAWSATDAADILSRHGASPQQLQQQQQQQHEHGRQRLLHRLEWNEAGLPTLHIH